MNIGYIDTLLTSIHDRNLYVVTKDEGSQRTCWLYSERMIPIVQIEKNTFKWLLAELHWLRTEKQSGVSLSIYQAL